MRFLAGALLVGICHGGPNAIPEDPIAPTPTTQNVDAVNDPAESQASIDARMALVAICPEATAACKVPTGLVAQNDDLRAALQCMLQTDISTIPAGPCHDALANFLADHLNPLARLQQLQQQFPLSNPDLIAVSQPPPQMLFIHALGQPQGFPQSPSDRHGGFPWGQQPQAPPQFPPFFMMQQQQQQPRSLPFMMMQQRRPSFPPRPPMDYRMGGRRGYDNDDDDDDDRFQRPSFPFPFWKKDSDKSHSSFPFWMHRKDSDKPHFPSYDDRRPPFSWSGSSKHHDSKYRSSKHHSSKHDYPSWKDSSSKKSHHNFPPPPPPPFWRHNDDSSRRPPFPFWNRDNDDRSYGRPSTYGRSNAFYGPGSWDRNNDDDDSSSRFSPFFKYALMQKMQQNMRGPPPPQYMSSRGPPRGPPQRGPPQRGPPQQQSSGPSPVMMMLLPKLMSSMPAAHGPAPGGPQGQPNPMASMMSAMLKMRLMTGMNQQQQRGASSSYDYDYDYDYDDAGSYDYDYDYDYVDEDDEQSSSPLADMIKRIIQQKITAAKQIAQPNVEVVSVPLAPIAVEEPRPMTPPLAQTPLPQAPANPPVQSVEVATRGTVSDKKENRPDQISYRNAP